MALKNEKIKIFVNICFLFLIFICTTTFLAIGLKKEDKNYFSIFSYSVILIFSFILIYFNLNWNKSIKIYISNSNHNKEIKKIDIEETFLGKVYSKSIYSINNFFFLSLFSILFFGLALSFIYLLKDVNWWIFKFKDWINKFSYSFGNLLTIYIIFCSFMSSFLISNFFLNKKITNHLETININKVVSIETISNKVYLIRKRWIIAITTLIFLPIIIYLTRKIIKKIKK